MENLLSNLRTSTLPSSVFWHGRTSPSAIWLGPTQRQIRKSWQVTLRTTMASCSIPFLRITLNWFWKHFGQGQQDSSPRLEVVSRTFFKTCKWQFKIEHWATAIPPFRNLIITMDKMMDNNKGLAAISKKPLALMKWTRWQTIQITKLNIIRS